MRVMNHNWSARKQRFHLQSVAGISRHSALSEDRIRQCETLSESSGKDTDQCLQVTISICRHCSVSVLCINGSVEIRWSDKSMCRNVYSFEGPVNMFQFPHIWTSCYLGDIELTEACAVGFCQS